MMVKNRHEYIRSHMNTFYKYKYRLNYGNNVKVYITYKYAHIWYNI